MTEKKLGHHHHRRNHEWRRNEQQIYSQLFSQFKNPSGNNKAEAQTGQVKHALRHDEAHREKQVRSGYERECDQGQADCWQLAIWRMAEKWINAWRWKIAFLFEFAIYLLLWSKSTLQKPIEKILKEALLSKVLNKESVEIRAKSVEGRFWFQNLRTTRVERKKVIFMWNNMFLAKPVKLEKIEDAWLKIWPKYKIYFQW